MSDTHKERQVTPEESEDALQEGQNLTSQDNASPDKTSEPGQDTKEENENAGAATTDSHLADDDNGKGSSEDKQQEKSIEEAAINDSQYMEALEEQRPLLQAQKPPFQKKYKMAIGAGGAISLVGLYCIFCWQGHTAIDYQYAYPYCIWRIWGTSCLQCNDQYVDLGACNRAYFYHPYASMLFFFIGQFEFVLGFIWTNHTKKGQMAKKDIAKNDFTLGRWPQALPQYLFMFVPAVLTWLTFILLISASYAMPPWLFAIGFFAAPMILQPLCLGINQREIYVAELIGNTIMIAAGILYGVADSTGKSEAVNLQHQVFVKAVGTSTAVIATGSVLFIFGIFCHLLRYSMEEYLYQRWSILPFGMLMGQGIWGIILTLLTTALMTLAPCGTNMKTCLFDPASGNTYLENLIQWGDQLLSPVLGGMIILFLIFHGGRAISGTLMAKYMGSIERYYIDLIALGSIAIINLLPTFLIKKPTDTLYLILFRILGLAMMIFGALTFFGIIRFSYKGILLSNYPVRKKAIVATEILDDPALKEPQEAQNEE